MSLLTPEIRTRLITNGKSNPYPAATHVNNVPPVCWVYDELGQRTWLLTEIDRHQPDRIWGLVDGGDGKPDYGHVSLRELEEGHKLLFDDADITIGTQILQGWKANGPLSAYIAAAAKVGRIVDLDHDAVA